MLPSIHKDALHGDNDYKGRFNIRHRGLAEARHIANLTAFSTRLSQIQQEALTSALTHDTSVQRLRRCSAFMIEDSQALSAT